MPTRNVPPLTVVVGGFLLGFCVAAGASPSLAEAAVELPNAPSVGRFQMGAGQQSAETEAERKARLHAEAEREVEKQEQQRILAVVPNFNTVITGRSVPLSAGQKTRLAVRATLDPFNLVGAFVLGGVSEVNGSHKGYRWGPGGYAKRVGANYADVVDGTMLAGAVYPILLHQDPRFFRQGTGSVRSRLAHALMAPFVCLGDNGKRQPNYSNVLGNFTAGAISNAYYPHGERGVGLTLEGGAVVLAEGSLGNIGLEFAPDVAAWWKARRERRSDPAVR